MTNRDISIAWKYHDGTKHTWESVRSGPHFLDWPNRPRPFKVYRDLEPIPLPREPHRTGYAALRAIRHPGVAPTHDTPVRLQDLASIFFYSAGITRRRRGPGGEILFRAASCTGALYSIELYAVCGDLEDLPAGIYLYSPVDSALYAIRRGDFRGHLVRATAGEAAVAHAPVTIVCTGTYWRNAWKYRARTYRHFGWDNGTILANLLAVAAARELPARVVQGFIDGEVNALLGLDTDREAALNLVPLGLQPTAVPSVEGPAPPLDLETAPYSQNEVDYPAMREMHAGSCLADPEEAADWRGPTGIEAPPPASGELLSLAPAADEELPGDSIEEVILRRGSSRRFRHAAISREQLSAILASSTAGVTADFLEPHGIQLNDLYVVCHAVDGVQPGAYYFHRSAQALQLLKPGEFRERAGYLGLEQALPADCSAAVFFLADLEPVLRRYGNRGYRAVQLEAGIIGGRVYLASYALRLGATGLTFYDDEVTAFFSPHAAGKSAIFLMATGVGA